MVIKERKKPTKPITTLEMEIAISRYFGVRQNIIVPNISWGFMNHEADMFIVKKSGYVIEVEIKRTKSDLLADFKKVHNHIDTLNRIQELYYAIPLSIYEKCKDLIPKNSGILVCEKYENGWSYVKRERLPIKVKGAMKLTEKEKLKIAMLGTMRIWSLKEKVLKLQNEKQNNKIQK